MYVKRKVLGYYEPTGFYLLCMCSFTKHK